MNKNILRIVASLIISFMIINFFFNSKSLESDADFAMGTETQYYEAQNLNNHKIHVTHINGIKSLNNLKSDWIKRGKNKIILLIGNSQYHSINQMNDGDINLSEILYNSFQDDKIDFLTVSLPNMNIQEQYLVTEYLNDLPIEILLIPVFMDDTRENLIRNEIIDFILKNPKTKSKESINSYLKNKNISLEKNDFEGISETLQEKVEMKFNEILNEKFSLWSQRASIRSKLFIYLYQTRNFVFNISPTTERRLIPDYYENNLQSLKLILEKRGGSSTVLYIPPIRNDVSIPYDQNEYLKFKNDIQSIAEQHEAYFLNLESALNNNVWGSKEATNLSGKSELDFMHFQYEGHKELSRILLNFLQDLINDI